MLSSSPPDSVHLAAADVARQTGVPWVADFRDPWVGALLRRAPDRSQPLAGEAGLPGGLRPVSDMADDGLIRALADRYRIEREIGGGGMSRVWLATETALDRQVVVKVIAPSLREGLSAERFTREVKLAARLQQANIVPVLSAGTADGVPYYTMPFVTGE